VREKGEEEQAWVTANRRHAGRCAGHPHAGNWLLCSPPKLEEERERKLLERARRVR